MRELLSLVFLLAAPPDAPLYQGPPAPVTPVQVAPVQRGPAQGPAAPNIVAPLTFAADLEQHRNQTVVLTGIYRDPGKGGPHILFDGVPLDITDDSFRIQLPDGTLQNTLNDGDCIRCRAHLAYFPGSQEPYEQAISRQSRGGRVVIADGVKLMIHAPQYSLRDAQLLARRPAAQVPEQQGPMQPRAVQQGAAQQEAAQQEAAPRAIVEQRPRFEAAPAAQPAAPQPDLRHGGLPPTTFRPQPKNDLSPEGLAAAERDVAALRLALKQKTPAELIQQFIPASSRSTSGYDYYYKYLANLAVEEELAARGATARNALSANAANPTQLYQAINGPPNNTIGRLCRELTAKLPQ